MQQVEQGKIDLDADVNQLPRLQDPAVRGQAGDDASDHDAHRRLRGAAQGSDRHQPRQRSPLRRAAEAMGAQAHLRAGHDAGLFELCDVARRLCRRARLRRAVRRLRRAADLRASADDPLVDAAAAPRRAASRSWQPGYRKASGETVEFEIVGPAPAGSMSSTGSDMARFMMAHLNGGELDGARILKPETARMMHTSIKKYVPPLDGMALGFFETDINGREVIAHLGDTGAFHTSLHSVPQRRDRALRVVQQRRESKAPSTASGSRSSSSSPTVISPRSRTPGAFPRRTRKKHAQMMAGNWIGVAARRFHLPQHHAADRPDEVSVGEGRRARPAGRIVAFRQRRRNGSRSSRSSGTTSTATSAPRRSSRMARSSGSASPSSRPSRCSSGLRSTRTRPCSSRCCWLSIGILLAHGPFLAGALGDPPLPRRDSRADRARPARLSPVAFRRRCRSC